MWPSKFRYDAFISHAVEDKLPIANELCSRLEAAGLKIWYSGKELMAGDSLEKTITRGLAQCRYGVVILSSKYLEKNWPMKEFYMLLTKEIENRKVILPVLYEITIDELEAKSMDMADRWSIPFNKGMDFVVDKIMDVVRPQAARKMTIWEWVEENIYALKFWFFMLVIAVLGSVVAYTLIPDLPNDNVILARIDGRISAFTQKIKNEIALNTSFARIPSNGKVTDIYSSFINLQSGYRNEYEFDNDLIKIRSKKNVEDALGIDLESISPQNNYNLTDPEIYYVGESSNAIYSFVNTKPVQYRIVGEELVSDDLYEVTVSYTHNLRVFQVSLLFPGDNQPLKKHRLLIKGFLPEEKYTFEKQGANWVLKP